MESSSRHAVIAVIGECLVELSGTEFGTLRQSFGGDTLNTALYLARLLPATTRVKYVTVLGRDSLSDAMLKMWGDEGIDLELTLRDPERLPGLYQIQVDGAGERRFLYWRQDSAARYLLQHAGIDLVLEGLSRADLIYLSGISLAILPAEDRGRLVELLLSLAARGVAIAFDTNYRERLWPSAQAARDCTAALLPATRLLFATFDDERRLWGDTTADATLARYAAAGIPSTIVKLGAAGCSHRHGDQVQFAAASDIAGVVDTTAAGDSFNAAFLAAWLAGRAPQECCQAGNRLAGVVIQHRGAITPSSSTPSLDALLA